ncbi:MAG: hypothetical protein WCL18_09580 [bacterium]
MKKVYMVGLLIMAASLAGCALKGPIVPNISTGDVLPIPATGIKGDTTT